MRRLIALSRSCEPRRCHVTASEQEGGLPKGDPQPAVMESAQPTNQDDYTPSGYLARGWAIFPIHSIVRGKCSCEKQDCSTPGKHPRTRSGVKDASKDPKDIASWEQMYPDANWAVACGAISGVMVLDVDPRHDGFTSLERVEIPDGTLSVMTGGGGLHYYFRHEVDFRNRTDALPGLDFKTDKGYVLLPGSNHIKGGTYRWNGGSDLTQLSDSLRTVLSRESSEERDAIGDSASILEGIPEGKRDDTLFRWACKLRRQLSSDSDGGRSVVTTLVLAAAEASGFPRDEALAKVDQAFRQDHSDPVLLNPFGESPSGTLRLVDGGVFVFDEPEEIPTIWGQGEDILWVEGEGLMIVGHQGLGKTTIGQQLMLARVGLREPEFLGLPVSRSSGTTLYLAMDRPRQAARSLRRMVTAGQRADLAERTKFWRGPLPVNPLAKGDLLAWVREVCPDIDTIIVDSVKDLTPDLTDPASGAALNTAFQSLIVDGIEVLLLHHERKASGDNKRKPSLDGIYGSTWLTSGLGSIIGLSGEPGGSEVGLHHLKQPAEVVGPLAVTHDHAAGLSTVERRQTMSLEGALMFQGSATVKQLVTMTGKSDNTVRRAISNMGSRVLHTPGMPGSKGPSPSTYTWQGIET